MFFEFTEEIEYISRNFFCILGKHHLEIQKNIIGKLN